MRALWAAGLLLRRLRTERGMILLLFVLIAGTSFVFAAAPRLFNRVSDDAVQYAAREASPLRRNVALSLASTIQPDAAGGVAAVRAYGDQLAKDFPPTLTAVISGRSLRLTSVRLNVGNARVQTHVSLRFQDGLTDATRLVSGRWPVDRGVPVRQQRPSDPTPSQPVIVEIALSSEAASEIGVKVGDRLAVTLDGTDPLLAATTFVIVPTELQVVGIFDAVDPNAEYWAGSAGLLHVTDLGGGGPTTRSDLFVTAYVPADAYPDLFASGTPFRYEWTYRVDPGLLQAGTVDQLKADLRRLPFHLASGIESLGTVMVSTGLLGILEGYSAQRALTASVLAIAALGPLALAAGALGMLAILIVARRRATLALARGRGASGSLLLGTQLWEAIVVALGASLLGLLAAVTLVPARASELSPLLAIAVGGAATALLLGASWPLARRPLGQLAREDPAVLRVSPRRLVLELTIVAIAIGAAVLLRQRGVLISGSGSAAFDPLLAAVPVLVGLGAGIVALRLYPLPIRGLGWLAAGRRDLVPVLGLRLIGRQRAAANLPLLVLLLTAAFAAFSSVIVTSVDRGQLTSSYEQVGADYRVQRLGIGALPAYLDPPAIDGIEAAAPGLVDPSAPFASTQTQTASIYLDAVDPVGYQKVTAGTAADPQWPDGMLARPSGSAMGTATNPIPAILSSHLPVGSASLGVGKTFRITIAGQTMTFLVVERRESFAGLGNASSFAVVPFNWVQAAYTAAKLVPSAMWLRAPAGIAPALTRLATRDPGSIHIDSRYEAYAALHDAPLGAAVGTGFGLALAIGAAYMAFTLMGALVLSAARRTQDLAYLRTLGVSGVQALTLTIVEQAPPVLLALVPGVALGIGLAFLLEPGLGLATFVGVSGSVALFVDWLRLAILVLALLCVAAAAIAVGTWLSRRARLVDALRIGDD